MQRTKTDYIRKLIQEFEYVSLTDCFNRIEYILNGLVVNNHDYIGVKSLIDMFMCDMNQNFDKTYKLICGKIGVKLNANFFRYYIQVISQYPNIGGGEGKYKEPWDVLGITEVQFINKLKEILYFFVEEKRYDADA